MAKVARIVATEDFERWLQYKKINDRVRQENIQFEEKIIDAIEDGILIINDDLKMEFSLQFPINNDDSTVALDKLIFKPRITVQQLNVKLKPVKPGDTEGMKIAYIAALTDQNSGMIAKLFTEDSTICQAICMYFL